MDILQTNPNLPQREVRKLADEWLQHARKRAERMYAGGGYTEEQMEALAHLLALQAIKIDRQIKASIEVYIIYKLHKNAMFHALGFNSLVEALDAFGINVQNGRGSQLYTIATVIIPWCEAFGVTTQPGEPVDINWATALVDGKSVASRMRNAVSVLRKIIASDQVPTSEKKTRVGEVLGWVGDPTITNDYLRMALRSDTPDTPLSVQVFEGGAWVSFVDNDQRKWFLNRIGGWAQITNDDYDALVIDEGLNVTINPRCLLPVNGKFFS